MIYSVFFKDVASSNTINTRNIEIARQILKEKFFKSLKMDEALDVSLEATETDTEKTGMIMQCRVKYKDGNVYGTVTATHENEFFVNEWNSELSYPQTYNVRFI